MDGGMEDDAPDRPCPRCSAKLPPDAAFCPQCGLPVGGGEEASKQYALYAPPPRPIREKGTLQTARELMRGIGAVMALLVLVLVTVNVGIMLWGMHLVIPEALEEATSLFVVLPWLVRFLELPGLAFVGYYLLLIVAVLLSYAFMLYKGGARFRKELRFQPTEHSPIYAIFTLFMAVLALNTAYYLLLALAGIEPSSGGAAGELWEMLYSLLRASVWEEVICRILYIGLPLGAVYILKGEGAPYRRYILGGNFRIGRWEKLFLVLSSAIFALAHVFSWDLYKVPPTFLAGLALGYLFLRYGVYASIMLHFTIDYLSLPMEVWPGAGTELVMGLFVLVLNVVGAVYLVYYSVRAVELFSGRKLWNWGEERPVSAYYRPLSPKAQAVATPAFGFVCKHCANTEARYVDGRFVCTRCGRES